MRDLLPQIADAAARTALDPKARVSRRLKAIESLVRIVQGPIGREPEHRDMVGQETARIALAAVTPFLDQVALSTGSDSARSKARELRALVAQPRFGAVRPEH
jgi:hypothetical protein